MPHTHSSSIPTSSTTTKSSPPFQQSSSSRKHPASWPSYPSSSSTPSLSSSTSSSTLASLSSSAATTKTDTSSENLIPKRCPTTTSKQQFTGTADKVGEQGDLEGIGSGGKKKEGCAGLDFTFANVVTSGTQYGRKGVLGGGDGAGWKCGMM